MPSTEAILTRIRAEFREMPGLILSFAQACRLWQLDRAECERVLRALVKENFLRQTPTGNFVALPQGSGGRALPVKVAFPANDKLARRQSA
jgi:hypothetical protein